MLITMEEVKASFGLRGADEVLQLLRNDFEFGIT